MRTLRVFVVDDDHDFSQSLANVISLDGHQVDTVFSGEEALRKSREQSFDVIFMDIRLPGMNGVESFIEIRQVRPETRVVMMTAFSVEELARQAIDNGALGVLSKPIDEEVVRDTLEAVLPAGIILVTDDDEDFLKSLRDMLVTHGYSVHTARTGGEAITMMRDNDIDVLLLDLRMPVMGGLEVYLELKRQKLEVPTIIVTGYAQEEGDTIDRLQSLSCKGYLEKPLDPDKLLHLLAGMVTSGGGAEN